MLASRLSSVSVLSRNLIKSVAIRCYAVNASMEKHQVVPDVVPVAPTEKAKVTYPSGVTVDEGNELTPTQVKDVPKVEWNADSSAFYTLCMTDPDAPSRQEPTYREVCIELCLQFFPRFYTHIVKWHLLETIMSLVVINGFVLSVEILCVFCVHFSI